MSSARDEILGKIRRSIGGSRITREGELAAVPRQYRQSAELDSAARLNLFTDRLHNYEAGVHRCSEAGIPETVALALAARGKWSLLVPPGLPSEWLPNGFEFIRDEELSYHEIEKSEGVLTGCAVAIAITGTIVLRHSPAEGRRALTLIPNYHLCVVYASQVVETVAEGVGQMAGFQTAPITTISGPSATADIEMTRVKGVHGPRILDVIIVGE